MRIIFGASHCTITGKNQRLYPVFFTRAVSIPDPYGVTHWMGRWVFLK